MLNKLQHKAASSHIALVFLHLLHSLRSLAVKRSSNTAENHQAKGNPWRGIETEGKKKNIFGAMCCRSKTWQSHDQRHLIILELHCSFNPSERTIFYWGGGGNNVRVANRAKNAVTSCWKCILLNVAWHFWGSRRRRQHKASLCVWRMEAELMELQTQMCHKSLSTQHWIVLLFFSWGLLGKLACWMWPDYDILHLAHREQVTVK